ncbi:hypothetical protein D3C79_911430 [compost metagenome]
MAHREPLGDVVQNAREEPGFGGAEQKAHHIEAVRPLDEGHADGDGAPGDHDQFQRDAADKPQFLAHENGLRLLLL